MVAEQSVDVLFEFCDPKVSGCLDISKPGDDKDEFIRLYE